MSTGHHTGRGALASIVASVLFAVMFLLPALVPELSPNEIFAWRALVALPLLTLFFAITGWGELRSVAARLRRRPLLIPVLVVQASLLSLQIWMFGWAPQTGNGLELALGYLLMPLVLVLLGVVLHRERMSPLRVVSVAAAALGVIAAFVIAGGGIGIATVLVAVGYPIYFTLRRRSGLDSLGAVWFEFALLVAAGVVWLLLSPPVAVTEGGGTLAIALLLGVISAVALVLYLVANRMLGFALFGLLSYLEPVLLVVVSIVLLREPVAAVDLAVYGPIVVALALLAIDSLKPRRR